jgi:tryptophan-rich sensory protein
MTAPAGGGLGRYARPVLAAAAVAALVAALGGAATDLGPWYQALAKPTWQPPDWLFGPVWTLIYAMTGLAGVLAWVAAPPAGRRRVLLAFSFNALLNVVWSELFFRLRRPDWAVAEVALLWLSILLLMVVVRPYSRRAVWLLVPYLAWVTFAAVLNLAIVRLNAPFDFE